MHYIRPILTHHRLKRLAAWAMLLLAWIAETFFAADAPAPKRRHIRQRYGRSVDRLARTVRNIIIVRSSQLLHREYRGKKFKPPIFSTPLGFARRVRPRHLLRSFTGGTLRRRLYARDPLARIAKLRAALADLEALAQAFASVIKRRLTRIFAITPVHPPHDAVCSHASPHECGADTS